MEIIETIIQMALSGICVYLGAAIYNRGYEKGLNAMSTRLTELQERNKRQNEKIKELYEYIGKDYCVNPFRGKSIHTKEWKEINQNHLKSKVKCKEIVCGEKRIK